MLLLQTTTDGSTFDSDFFGVQRNLKPKLVVIQVKRKLMTLLYNMKVHVDKISNQVSVMVRTFLKPDPPIKLILCSTGG